VGESQVSILAKILEADPAKLSLKNAAVPPELERIIEKCLQKDPNDRYQDTRDLVVDLRSLRRQYDSGVTESVSTMTAAAELRKGRGVFGKTLAIAGPLLIIAAALVFLSGVFQDHQSNTAVASADGLAILGFDNKTGDEELDWLQTGLPEILLTDLAQTTNVRVISQRRVLDCLGQDVREVEQVHSHQECVDAARSLGATTVLSGSFFRIGEQIRIDARLEDVETNTIIYGEKVIGEDPFILVDSLTKRIAVALNADEAAGGQAPVARYTTSSQDAYKFYHLGMEDFLNGRFTEAVAKFEESLEHDSTFALPYMRIGIARQLEGRQQEAAQYLALAKQNEDRLPNYERNLLDVYADLWLNFQINDAIAKLRTLVGNYPDDKESKSLLGLLEAEVSRDTARAVELFDEVLAQDPSFRLALNWYSDMYATKGLFERAEHYTRQILEYHPKSYDARMQLARLLFKQGQLDEAKSTYEQILEQHSDDPDALLMLQQVAVRKREFGQAKQYLDRFADVYGSDPFQMIYYHQAMSDLVAWRGEFRGVLDHLQKAASKALEWGDSTAIMLRYEVVSTYFERFGMLDSALYFAERSYEYASSFRRLSYPIMMVSLDTSYADEARPIFIETMRDLRARVPSEMWGLIDALEMLFSGFAAADTAIVISGFEQLIAIEQAEGSKRALGWLRVLYGRYEEGLKTLEPFVSGESEATHGDSSLYSRYLIGVAHAALGDYQKAMAAYREVLEYWSSPDMEIDAITDARERLQRLSSRASS
jgi:tetratricopeptide (TPR) repeat protein